MAHSRSNVQRKKSAEEILGDGRTKYHVINTTDDGRKSVLIVSYANTDTTYYCKFGNFKGSKEKYFHVMIQGLGAGIIAAVTVAAFVVVAIILLVLFLKRYYKQKVLLSIKLLNSSTLTLSNFQVKKMHQELFINRLRLLEGNVERINLNLPLEDQLDLLPYDNKYEFPSNNLVLGEAFDRMKETEI